MKCYRRVLRVLWSDRVTNEEVRRRVGVSPGWLMHTIKKQKLKYFGHVKRHDNLEKHILEAKLNGKRRKGRPTKCWEDNIKEWTGKPITEAGRIAKNRKDFRRLVWEATAGEATPD